MESRIDAGKHGSAIQKKWKHFKGNEQARKELFEMGGWGNEENLGRNGLLQIYF